MEENKSYPVFIITVIILVFYLTTYVLAKTGFLRLVTHRKFWNILLLVSITVCGLLGVFLAFQVNYKWKISWLDQLTELHVDFGISLFIIAVFHILWHFYYFKKLIGSPPSARGGSVFPPNGRISPMADGGLSPHLASPEAATRRRRRGEERKIQKASNVLPLGGGLGGAFYFAILTLGFSSICVQIILLREFLSVFYGNELVIGIILANWMLLTGLGAWLGKTSGRILNKTGYLAVIHLLIAVLPPITLFLLSFLRNIVFPPGGIADMMQVWYFSLLLLLPFCLVSGLAFTLFCTATSERYNGNSISTVYSLESVGSLAGGLAFNLILIFFLKPFQNIYIIMLLNFLAALLLSYRNLPRSVFFILPAAFVIAIVYPLLNLGSLSKKFLFKGQEIVFFKDTPYGNLTITKSGEQVNFFENGLLLFSSNNVIYNEEAVHFAMVQHPAPKDVLLISGGLSGMLDEIFKYPVSRVDYVEINPWLVKAAEKYFPKKIPAAVTIVNGDARMFIRETGHHYDVVLINLPEPATTGINRYYTFEFFSELKTKMKQGSILATQLSPTVNYMSEEARKMNSVLYATLQKIFKNVIVIPGAANHFLASDNELNSEPVAKMEQKNIPSEYVRYYLNDAQLTERSGYIMQNISGSQTLNRDFEPVSCYFQLHYWLSQFKTNYWILLTIAGVVLIVILLRFDVVSFGLFAGGFAGSSIEIVLIVAYQILYGYVYSMLGILIAIFMAGLATGSVLSEKVFFQNPSRKFLILLSAMTVLAMFCPFILEFLHDAGINTYILHAVLFIIIFKAGVFTGGIFSTAVSLRKESIAAISGLTYSADLIGSAIGALVFAAFLIPATGIRNSCFITGLITMIAALIIFAKKRHYYGGH